MDFSKTIIRWYLQHKRDLPWRETTNPYHVWLSEIILQQTRVAQGLSYYNKFVSSFKTINDFAAATEQDILKLWQGLGYYSRARNMHKTAQVIVRDFNGVFPNNYQDLLKLKGVGTYTAAAIASFSYREPVAVVDGNVYRVLSRYFGLYTDILSTKAKKEFTALAQELLDKASPDVFNQAIMEFGALQCVPKNPDCAVCALNDSCYALQKKAVQDLPVKLKKTKIKQRYLNYVIFIDAHKNTLLNKRTQKDIWHNLYEFTCLEYHKNENSAKIIKDIQQQFFSYDLNSVCQLNNEPIIHKLSHQSLHINFFEVRVDTSLKNAVSVSDLHLYPFPIIIWKFIEKHFKDYFSNHLFS